MIINNNFDSFIHSIQVTTYFQDWIAPSKFQFGPLSFASTCSTTLCDDVIWALLLPSIYFVHHYLWQLPVPREEYLCQLPLLSCDNLKSPLTKDLWQVSDNSLHFWITILLHYIYLDSANNTYSRYLTSVPVFIIWWHHKIKPNDKWLIQDKEDERKARANKATEEWTISLMKLLSNLLQVSKLVLRYLLEFIAQYVV